jgi:hypothetical protein
MMTALAKPVSTVSEDSPNIGDLAGNLTVILAQYEKPKTAIAQRSLYIEEPVLTEIVNKETIQPDSAILSAKDFG